MSFKPKSSIHQYPSTKVSIHNGLFITSSGVSSFDDLLGGGIPIGTLNLIKQDRFTEYAQLLFKYFLAQGIISNHSVSLISADSEPKKMIQDLMGLSKNSSLSKLEQPPLLIPAIPTNTQRQLGGLRDDRMAIAWRYQNLPQFSSTLPSKTDETFCSTFDLTKKMDKQIIEKASSRLFLMDLSLISLDDSREFYKGLYKQIQELIQMCKSKKSLLRLGIDSLASALWPTSTDDDKKLCIQFIYSLKSLIRINAVVCMITLPAFLYNDFEKVSRNPFIYRIEHGCDCVVEVESFTGSPTSINERYTSDYTGLIHPIKLPKLNSLSNMTRISNISLKSLGFKVQRKRFTIEMFHLPPEEADENDVKEKASKNIDF